MAELAKNNRRASRKAQYCKRKASERQLTVLESRTVTVNLPAGYGVRPGIRLTKMKEVL